MFSLTVNYLKGHRISAFRTLSNISCKSAHTHNPATPVFSVPIDPESTCDCVTQALWQRNLAWTR